MFKIPNQPLSNESAQNRLDHLHNKVAQENSFSDKVNKAQRLWKAKSSANIDKTTFAAIREELQALSPVPNAYCHYCEHNEEADIEHIVPKGFFPLDCFSWTNYLLACKKCNSGYKKDRMYVFFPPANNLDNQELKRIGPENIQPFQPDRANIAFIHPRLEDPFDFLWLNLSSFMLEPKEPNGSRAHIKAQNTINILGLNREFLIHSREKAFVAFFHALKEYVDILSCSNHSSLEAITLGPCPLTTNFNLEKDSILENLKKHILSLEQQTVLKEICRQQSTLPPQKQAIISAINWLSDV